MPRRNGTAWFYTGMAVIILNTLIFLVVVNLLLGVAFWTYDQYRYRGFSWILKSRANAFFYKDGEPIDNGKRDDYMLNKYDFTALEGVKPEEAAATLDDFFALTLNWFNYQPWVQYADAPIQSKHLNILWDDAGFPLRRTPNPDNPDKLPEIVVWTFGGSTTFGYWVADWQTWPSYLSQLLNERARQEHLGVHIQVKNYGRAHYEPTQEVILLWDLLRSGQRPSLVIFMDGVNTGAENDWPSDTERLAKIFKVFQGDGYRSIVAEALKRTPLGRLASLLSRKFRGEVPAPVIPEDQMVRWLSNRFQASWRLADELSRHYGADLMACLQPSSFYDYDSRLFRFPIGAEEKRFKRKTEALYKTLHRETDCLFLGDLFKEWGPRRKAILTDCHYTPDFNKFLAEHVAAHIDLKKLSISPGYLPRKATGAPRPKD